MPPRQLAPHERVVDLAANDNAGPSQSQSQSRDYRRLTRDEETSLVKIAVQHADIRKQVSVRSFCVEVKNSFEAVHRWQYKSVGRKLLDLESEWREIFKRRASGTGSENEGNDDLSQAMQAWLEIVDEEKRTKKERKDVREVARIESLEADVWRANLTQRLRNKTKEVNALEVVELPSDEEHVDVSDNENTVAAEAAHAALPRLGGPSTPLLVSDSDAATSSVEQSSPTPARSTARGNGRKRPGVMSSPLSVKSPRKDTGASTLALILQLDERRAIREEAARKEQAERDELREQRREEREAAARERELAAQQQMQLQMMQQMSIMMQAIVRREQPVQLLGDYPPQSYAPPAPPAFQDVHNENSHHSSEATTRQPPNRFG
jgi:hypothetical protein